MPDESMLATEAATAFNTFSVEVRSRIESLIKQILIISGGIQTITISAFLSGSKVQLAAEAIDLLKSGWLQLSASIILCLVFMLFQIFALTHVGLQHKRILENPKPGISVMTAWLPLRILNWSIGIFAFIFCMLGVYTISKAAISLIGTQGCV